MNSVIIYHTISTRAEPLPGDIDIAPERFASQLQWLARWRRVVRLDETLSSGQRRAVAITFDDGFRDNLTVALPLLEKFGLADDSFCSWPDLWGAKDTCRAKSCARFQNIRW